MGQILQYAAVEAYLSDAFLDRVRRAYRRALDAGARTSGQWRAIDARRRDVHAAVLADGNTALRAVFADPIATDLYYGTDNLCRSYMRSHNRRPFLDVALESGRAVFAQHQLGSLQSALAATSGTSVIEIGPGVGHCAFFAHRVGIDYATIDLPLGIVAQACFLGRAVSPEKIWFEGEAETRTRDQIRLYSIARLPDDRFDVVLNVDSMTEMPLRAALDYADWINRHARVFISINHEQNPFRVADIARLKMNIAKSSRHRWAPRAGYFEETFFIAPNATTPGKLLLWLRTKSFARRALRALRQRIFGLLGRATFKQSS